MLLELGLELLVGVGDSIGGDDEEGLVELVKDGFEDSLLLHIGDEVFHEFFLHLLLYPGV